MIYVASPYFHNSLDVMTARYHEAQLAAVFLLRAKKWNFSPVAYCHEMANRYGLPRDFEFWREYDEHMVSISSDVYVLCIEGWNRSLGVANEIELAKKLGLPVTHMIPDDLAAPNAAYTFKLA